jgi:ectoine hydroxylase-related dioxygenase (phytanoyl-CoA dioxygenase family)
MANNIIPECSANTSPDSMYKTLAESGCLVIHDIAEPDTIAKVRDELAETMASAPVEENDPTSFYAGKTRRAVALIHRSPTALELMMDARIEKLCDKHLLENCDRYHLNVTAAVDVGPGARDQILHREEDLFPYFTLPRPNLILATMWALSDFTVENGGTQLVPGSHRWEAGRVAEPSEVARAAMPAGSVLVWLGGTLHGAGANTTIDNWRYGMILTYALSWLRQEENQNLSMTLEEAFSLPEAVQSRMGFSMDYEGGLGFYDPSVILKAGK